MAHAMLPSSPPQRMRSRSRSQDSDYSLDLDALLPESSEFMTPPRKTAVDIVHSEDIDGPTDFTQNLEYWMTAKLPHAASPNVTKPASLPEGKMRGEFEEFVSSDDAKEEGTPKKGMVLEYDEKITPRTVERASLQPSVEDYDSPAPRSRDTRSASSSAIGATLRSPEHTLRMKPLVSTPEEEVRKYDEEKSDIIKNLEETLQKLKEELESLRVQSQQEVGRLKAENERALAEQKASHEHYKSVAERELAQVRKMWNDRVSSMQREHEEELLDLRSQRLAQDTENQEVRQKDVRITELEGQLQSRNDEAQSTKRENTILKRNLEALEEQHRITTEDLAQERHDNDAEYETLKSRLERMEASKLDAEEKLENLRAELAHMKLEHESELDEATTRIEDAENRINRAVAEEKKVSQETIKQLESENVMLHDQLDGKDDEIERVKNECGDAKRALEVMKQENTMRMTKAREQKTLNDQAAREIRSLRSGTKILQSQLKDATSYNEELKSLTLELKASRAATVQAESETACAKNEIQQLREDYELINKAMDKKMRDIMKSRELEWSKRFEVLEREMGLRGRVLMREWGVRELGEAEPQGYRYKYV